MNHKQVIQESFAFINVNRITIWIEIKFFKRNHWGTFKNAHQESLINSLNMIKNKNVFLYLKASHYFYYCLCAKNLYFTINCFILDFWISSIYKQFLNDESSYIVFINWFWTVLTLFGFFRKEIVNLCTA